MVMLLVALLAVGWLARSALKQMGLADGPSSAIVTGKPTRPLAAGATGIETTSSPSTAAPIDRARTVQAEVLQQGAATQEQLNRVER